MDVLLFSKLVDRVIIEDMVPVTNSLGSYHFNSLPDILGRTTFPSMDSDM